MDKQAFWSRVRVGKERVDTLAREVFCQTVLTLKGEGSRCKSEPDLSFESCSEFGSENGSEFGSERGSEYGSDTNSASDTEGIFYIEDSSWEPSARRYTSDGDGDGGGGVVRLHSILETANELVSVEAKAALNIIII